jgi:hypothetical protein
MNYNIKNLNGVAEELAKLIKTIIEAQEQEQVTIAEIESGMREVLRELGNQMLGIILSSLETTPANEIACPCGGELEYQRIRPATLISVFGRVTYERAYYANCNCKRGLSPLDKRFGLEPGAVTAGLAQLLALIGVGHSYDESPKWLEAFLLFSVSENTVRSETEKMGALQGKIEEELIQKSQDETYLQERQRNPGKSVPRLYGSMDAAKVRIEPRPRKGKAPEKQEDWRDMKVLCWFEAEQVPPAQRSARHKDKVERNHVPLRAKNIQYFADITDAESFGKLLWATGCVVNADLSPELVFLGDGAVWIWNLVDQYYPNAIQIVDWYHAEEYLDNVAKAAFSSQSERSDWLEEVTQALWDGRVEKVISTCASLDQSCDEVRKAISYFSNNIERMRYELFRDNGLMIGSGTVESACKQIVTQRLKLPGAQWIVSGAVQTAKARSAWLSNSWTSLCKTRAALPLAV